ncbi:TonB-denpendent receptor [Thiomicrospira aerophila AL3]|uniref:TonB-denpendent receptor n=1 Tax=Thiomicrospira aerophila AL3 TaxID=717772 RepID=W0DTH6_9GAMM|nr:TonB-dependent hemoglobin/transferrin/lactoferrin family receptor [Thiomicrospira aerophila]AHF01732.1 TonB-denpendent receptor [Thiomicrospira aerophila AL3]
MRIYSRKIDQAGLPKPKIKPLTLFIASLMAVYAGTAAADSTLEKITVTLGGIEQELYDTANTVTVIDQKALDKTQATGIKDLFRYQPGIAIKAQPMRAGAALGNTGRGGNEGINIRGLEGNQVTLLSDGVPIPATFSFGPMLVGRGDYLEPEGYKRVEILRGPSSSLYGSDGLAGAVSFQTKDPEDLLTLGNNQQITIRTGYDSANRGTFITPAVAFKNNDLAGLLLFTQRRYSELDNQGNQGGTGAARTRPNPQNNQSDYLLGKLRWQLNDQHQLQLTGESLHRQLKTNVKSGLGRTQMGLMSWDTTALTAKDTIERQMLKLDYSFEDFSQPLIQSARISAYHQSSTNRQFTEEKRTGSSPTFSDRTRNNRYEEDIKGVRAQFESNFGEQVHHRISYGADYSLNRITQMRDGTPRGTSFPTKDFPDSDYVQLGLFVQDEITLGRLSIIPGLRYDQFSLTPARSNDPIYPGVTPISLNDSALSKKLGLVFKQSPMLNYYVQYSEGFRAPTPTNVNSGFTNLTGASPYKTISNPDLKPETSQLYEIGLRGQNEQLSYQISLFHTDYKDFIELTQVGGAGTPADPTLNQSINRDRAEVQGIEADVSWRINNIWRIMAGFNYNEGRMIADGKRSDLATVEPSKLVLGARYKPGDYALELIASHAAARNNPDDELLSTHAYTTLDLLAEWDINKHWQLQGGVFNLTNEAYLHWSDVRNQPKTSSSNDAFTQPGRSLKVSLTTRF